ncbi:BamA/TamA family outer membrane protein [Hymenobacter properus]|uniref:BamA/TamA family outer membrane protein n=1 Tax=Hymenobacter properus TaxID=2791026 RepID=A0A931FNJ5_9BACT|nr:BamA/TamA family outer membrane protein [Hymenobacter properus]MBF9142709.1 BamA/TamA family outer membrane protein [Hymenobacter properus]MBR7721517.1 BamA/TamA family outer membrane protein [Microvirga sp. SRT04]
MRCVWGCLLLLAGLATGPRARAQTPGLDPNAPNQPGLASPPLPPRAAPEPAPAQRRALAHPRVLQIDAETADRAIVRRYKLPATVPDSLTALREVRELVLALQADAYLTASADEMRWRRDTVRVRLYVGEAFSWAYLRNGNLGDGLMTRAGYREKLFRQTPFRPDDWARLQERILTEAENQGFPFATVGLDSLQLSGHAIAGRVVLKRGPAVVFDSLQIVGNTKTKKRFLTKYLQIFPEQPFSQQRVAAAAQLLRQLPYLRLRAEPEVRFARGRARVYLLLEDRPSNQFDAIVGILPNANASQTSVQFTGDVTINLRNIKGGGKQLGLQWRKTDALSQLLDAQYVHPNFFGTPLEVSGTFNLYNQTNSFLTVRPRLQITYPTVRAGRVSFFAEQRSSQLTYDSITYANLRQLPEEIDSKYTSYGLGYAWTSLDDLFFPHRGYLLNGQAAVGTKAITQNAQIPTEFYSGVPLHTTQTSFALRAERYFPVKRAGVLLVRLRNEGLLNPRLFTNDLLRLGGLNSLRGFNENQFYTSSFALATAEFRQFIGADSYVFLFADQAYLRHDAADEKFSDQPTGLGAGLSFRTGAGLFQFVYSVGQSNYIGQKFALNASKIHFGLTSRF